LGLFSTTLFHHSRSFQAYIVFIIFRTCRGTEDASHELATVAHPGDPRREICRHHLGGPLSLEIAKAKEACPWTIPTPK